MHYKEKRIPTLLALLIIFFGITGIISLDQSSLNFSSTASPQEIPKDIHFSNISEKSITISWLSDKPVLGSVSIAGSNFQSKTLFDDLDNDNVARPRIIHYVSVNNLNEDTLYKIKIINGTTQCGLSNKCPELSQKTTTRLPSFLSIPPAKGQIIAKDNQPAVNAIVYLTVGNSSLLSTRTDSYGLWVIPFTNLRSADLSKRIDLSDNDIVQITAKTSENQITSGVIDIKSIRQNLNIPIMQIGNSYNFINLISKKDIFAANLPYQRILGIQTNKTIQPTLTISENANGNKDIDILYPTKEQNTAIDNRPKIRGIGPKGTTLTITVKSTPQTAKIVISNDGTWSYRPPKPLSPGIHEIILTGVDQTGKSITLKREFIVLKSGESVLGEATSSATITPGFTTTPSITPVTSQPTITPALTISPTIQIITPTLILSPTNLPATPIPSPTSIPPRTGSFEPVMLLFGISCILLILGVKMVFLP
jgi:hypothetical protein